MSARRVDEEEATDEEVRQTLTKTSPRWREQGAMLMKIALVSPYDITYPGGVVSHISNLGRELEERGHSVKVLAPVANAKSLGIDNLIAVGRPVPVPSNGSIARISLSLWRERTVKSVLREEAFDIVHLHEPLAPVLPLTVLHHSEAPNIGTFHSFSEHPYKYTLSHRFLHGLDDKLDSRIAVSTPAMRYVSRFFPGDYKIIPNGLDVDFYSQDVPPFDAFCDGKLNILFVGRLEKRKGLRYLLEAFSRLKWDYPFLRLIVVGRGNPGKECYQIMAERNLQDVVFVGGVSEEHKRRYFRTAHIFCAPSLGKESFGIVLGEAMASGKPIVASDIEGYASVMTSGREGFLVPPKDEKALAEALERLILDPGLRAEMGESGRITVQRYRWDKVAALVEAVYREAAVGETVSVP
ncbi:MAG: glycosyltransferase family 4 protein [Chloroflexi bacterium]|nr:glycosyltransferase family 4 protein [Chloroflexota bacterium]